MRLLLNWILSAVAVWVVAQIVSGVYVSGWKSALIAALIIGFINATIGLFLKVITFPLTLVTLGVFWLVINALMLELASALLSPGFQVHGFLAAFLGAIVLSLVNMLLKGIVMPKKDSEGVAGRSSLVAGFSSTVFRVADSFLSSLARS